MPIRHGFVIDRVPHRAPPVVHGFVIDTVDMEHVIPGFYAKTEYSSYAWPMINCSTHTVKSAPRKPNVINIEYNYYIIDVFKD
jgi:hypothetical protein